MKTMVALIVITLCFVQNTIATPGPYGTQIEKGAEIVGQLEFWKNKCSKFSTPKIDKFLQEFKNNYEPILSQQEKQIYFFSKKIGYGNAEHIYKLSIFKGETNLQELCIMNDDVFGAFYPKVALAFQIQASPNRLLKFSLI